MSGHHITMPVTYTKVLIGLLIFMALTVAVAKVPALDFGQTTNLLIALTIASIKTLLVVLFFMQVKFSEKLVQICVAVAFLWLSILFILTFTDFATRNWLGNIMMH